MSKARGPWAAQSEASCLIRSSSSVVSLLGGDGWGKFDYHDYMCRFNVNKGAEMVGPPCTSRLPRACGLVDAAGLSALREIRQRLEWLTLSLLAYVRVGFAAHVDWPAALRSTVVPKLHWEKDCATTIVAILGKTISPYLFFWQAAQEVEEINRVGEDKPLRTTPEQEKSHLQRLRIDTVLGVGLSNFIAFCMIVATAATLHTKGISNIETTSQAAQALEPIAGKFAFLLFGLGVVGTGLLACRCWPVRPPSRLQACFKSARASTNRRLAQRPFTAFLPQPCSLGQPSVRQA